MLSIILSFFSKLFSCCFPSKILSSCCISGIHPADSTHSSPYEEYAVGHLEIENNQRDVDFSCGCWKLCNFRYTKLNKKS